VAEGHESAGCSWKREARDAAILKRVIQRGPPGPPESEIDSMTEQLAVDERPEDSRRDAVPARLAGVRLVKLPDEAPVVRDAVKAAFFRMNSIVRGASRRPHPVTDDSIGEVIATGGGAG
jgi:hypothetical protein